jgi:chemotaxis methyl-accepting protein methylase
MNVLAAAAAGPAARRSPGPDVPVEEARWLEAIVELIRVADRFDFSPLTPPAVRRRVERRMRLHGVGSVAQYLALLDRSHDERLGLRTDLLANGTLIFREPKVWQFIESHVVPSIVSRSDPARPIRVWVPQCGAGSDAYSLALLLLEQKVAARGPTSVQVFASDEDEETLGVARAGHYPWVADTVGPARLRRFFVEGTHGWQVTRELRRSVVFARHDLFSDPPFSHLDMICWRNILGYLRDDARITALGLLQQVLNEDGYLVLGMHESAAGFSTLEPVSRRWSVYRRIPAGPDVALEPTQHRVSDAAMRRLPALPATAAPRLDWRGRGDTARLLRLVEMGRLAAGLAHEVSQPLGAVANILEALAARFRGEAPAHQEELDLVEQGISQSDRARRLVIHVARLLRKGERTMEECDIRDLAAGAADLVRASLREHRITLELVGETAPCRARVCHVEIEQVLVNLLQNAIDAVLRANNGPRRIFLETRLTPGGHVKVRVSDSGAGIPPELADRMFEPFFTTKRDGLGMGLAISRSIVDDHGGCIWVEQDHEGNGGGVCFVLPCGGIRS